MAMDKDDVIDTLNELIETCKDGELGFRDCAENIRDPSIQQMMMTAADRCRQGADELQREVQLLGGKAETSGSLAGSAHRRWVDIKGTIMGKDEASVLAECERGEDVAKESYQRALERELPRTSGPSSSASIAACWRTTTACARWSARRSRRPSRMSKKGALN